MKTQRALKRLTLAATLTAISIAIDVFFKYALGLTNFGVPFYAIPIVFGSIVLGPIYGVIMSVVGDAVGVMLSGYGYLPLFVLAPVLWGLIPGLIIRKDQENLGKLAVTLFVAYSLASLANTYAIYYYYSFESAMATLYVRIGLIPFNIIVMFFMMRELMRKLKPVSERYLYQVLKNDKY